MNYRSAEESYMAAVPSDREQNWNTVGGDVYEHVVRLENQNKQLRKTQLEMAGQLREIHQFIAGIAGALNHPMLRAMVPPELLSQIPKQNGS